MEGPLSRPRFNLLRLSPLTIRVLSGAALLLAVIALVFVGQVGVTIVVLVVGGLALWEFQRLSGRMGFRAPAWLLFPLGAYFAFSGTVLRFVKLELVLDAAVVAGLAVFLFLPGRRQGLGRWAFGLGGALYVGLPMNYLLQLYEAPRGLVWVLFVLLAVVVSDAAALLVGMRLGRHPFFQSISPKKTVEGAIAGIVLPVPVFLLGGFGILGLNPLHALGIGLLVGLSAEIGDLVESQMKRIAGVKDSSHLIPGHGGMLDRIDSLMFAPIVVYIYASSFGLLH
jgi:phosphatidate cytidylyltransferase